MKITGEMVKAALSAKMPDGLSVVDHLEDALPSREDLEALGCPTTGYYQSDIRADMHDWFYEVLISRILTAALSASPAGVKPMEWITRENRDSGRLQSIAHTIVGTYAVTDCADLGYIELHERATGKVSKFKTIEAAKSAAFADYSARIMSAIEPAGVDTLTRQMRERMISDMKDLIEFLAENPDNIYHLDADKVAELRRAIEPAGVGVETYTAGQRVTYDSGYWTVDGEVTGNVEGWWNVRFDDGSSATVRPSSIRAALKGDEQ